MEKIAYARETAVLTTSS